MAKVRVPFQLGEYQDGNDSFADQLCVNMYPSSSENPGGVSPATLKEIEGVLLAGDTTISSTVGADFPLRAAVADTDNMFCIYDDHLFSVSTGAGGTATDLGLIPTITAGVTQLSIAWNGKLVAIVESQSTNVVFYDVSAASFSTVATPSGYLLNDVTFQDDIFVYSGRVPSSIAVMFHGLTKADASKGAAFNALDFTLPDLSTSNSIESLNGLIYIMDSIKTLIYQFAGTTPFAFRKLKTEICTGTFFFSEKIVVGPSMFMLGTVNGSDKTFVQVSGTQALRIATKGIEKILSDWVQFGFGTVDTWNYKSGNNSFVGWNLYDDVNRQAGITVVYDINESQRNGFPVWHTRKTDTKPTFIQFSALGSPVARPVTLGYKKLAGGAGTNDLAFIDITLGDELGEVLDKDVAFNYINTQFEPIRFKRFQLLGDNLLSTIELSYGEVDGSGGITESTARESGSSNQNFLEWRRLGQSKLSRRFRLKMDQDTQNTGRMTFTDAYVEVPDGG